MERAQDAIIADLVGAPNPDEIPFDRLSLHDGQTGQGTQATEEDGTRSDRAK